MDNLSKKIISYNNLDIPAGILHFTSTKQSISIPNPRFTGDSPEIYLRARKELGNTLGIDSQCFVFPRQTHSKNIKIVHQVPEEEIEDVDALITNKPGICLCIQTADCLPILLFDPIKKVIAAIHAGWRGTVQKILHLTVLKMMEEFHCNPKNIVAAIGPSICQEKYEVGEDVISEVKKKLTNSNSLFTTSAKPGKAYLDLKEANTLQLLEAGLLKHNIHVSGLCSFTATDQFYSARRQGVKTGRIVTGIMLK